MSSLQTILCELNLEQFAAAFEKEGFVDSNDLIDLGEQDARELAVEVGMGRGHIVRLLRWIREQLKIQHHNNNDNDNETEIISNDIVSIHNYTKKGDGDEVIPMESSVSNNYKVEEVSFTESTTLPSTTTTTTTIPTTPIMESTSSGHLHSCSVNHGNEIRKASLWCDGGCGWICQECAMVHAQHSGLFLGHTLMPFPPPKPFWEELNIDSDNDRMEIFTVDFSDPRLVKRDQRNWHERFSKASADDHVPVVSFVGPTGSGKSFLLTSLMAPEARREHGPTVSAACQHEPESGNVFVFDSGEIEDFSKMLLVDFEGEDGAVPRSLMRRITRLADPAKMAESLASASASAANMPKHLSKFLEKASQQARQQAAAFSARAQKRAFAEDRPYKSRPLINAPIPVPIKRGSSNNVGGSSGSGSGMNTHVYNKASIKPRMSKFQELDIDIHNEIHQKLNLIEKEQAEEQVEEQVEQYDKKNHNNNHDELNDDVNEEEDNKQIYASPPRKQDRPLMEPGSSDTVTSNVFGNAFMTTSTNSPGVSPGGSGGGGGGRRSRSVSEDEMKSSQKGLLGALEQLGDEWQYELWSINRRETVNRVLPVLAYLLSDVIVFVDTVEPRRLQAFFERVQDFASTAWSGCKASGWQPALIMIQNKWNPGTGDEAFDITDQFFTNIDKGKGLQKVFSSVHFLRMPHSTVNAGDVLARAVNVLRKTIAQAATEVKQKRMAQGTLFMEKEWWRLAPKVAEEYSRTREPVSLPRIQLRAAVPTADDEGVDQLFAVIDQSTKVFSEVSDSHFNEVKRNTLEIFRHSVATRMRRTVRTAHDAEVYGRECFSLSDKVTDRYRCCSATTTTPQGTFRCTQLRRGHGSQHRNPTLVDISGRVASWLGWKTQIPVQWSGNFEEPATEDSAGQRENEWLAKLDELLQLTDEQFFWRYISTVEDVGLFRKRGTFHHFACLRCLQPIKQPGDKRRSLLNDKNKSSTMIPNGGDGLTITNNDINKLSSSDNSTDNSIDKPDDGAEALKSSPSQINTPSNTPSQTQPPNPHICSVNNHPNQSSKQRLRMLSGCGHFVCESCVTDGKKIAGLKDTDDVVCGICGQSSSWISSLSLLPPDCGPRVLSLDGGGIRGLVEITVLKHLCRLTGGLQPHELFDIIGGTSTGGILAISFGALQKSPEIVHDSYVKLTGSIFKRTGLSRVLPDTALIAIGHTILNNQILESDLQTNYGPDKSFGDFPLLPKFFVTAFDIVTEKTAVFGNFCQSEDDLVEEELPDNPVPKFGSIEFRRSSHVNLWKAALASSAVPFYFPAVGIDEEMYADGGMDANCPVEAALASAEYQFPNRAVEILLSLGAGTPSSDKMKKEEARAEAKGRGIGWITTLLSLQMESDRKWTECVARLSTEVKKSMIRINPSEVGNIDPFDATKCEEAVEMTENKLKEPMMSSLLLSAASRLKAKAYFLQSPSEAESDASKYIKENVEDSKGILKNESESNISKRYVKVKKGGSVSFEVKERVTRQGALPSAKVRRFSVQAEVIRVSHLPSEHSELSSHLSTNHNHCEHPHKESDRMNVHQDEDDDDNDEDDEEGGRSSLLKVNDVDKQNHDDKISEDNNLKIENVIESIEGSDSDKINNNNLSEESNLFTSTTVLKSNDVKLSSLTLELQSTNNDKTTLIDKLDDNNNEDNDNDEDKDDDDEYHSPIQSPMISLSTSCPTSSSKILPPFIPLSSNLRASSFSHGSHHHPIPSANRGISGSVISNQWFEVNEEATNGSIIFKIKKNISSYSFFKNKNNEENKNNDHADVENNQEILTNFNQENNIENLISSSSSSLSFPHHRQRSIVVIALVVNLIETSVGGISCLNPISGCPCLVYLEIND